MTNIFIPQSFTRRDFPFDFRKCFYGDINKLFSCNKYTKVAMRSNAVAFRHTGGFFRSFFTDITFAKQNIFYANSKV